MGEINVKLFFSSGWSFIILNTSAFNDRQTDREERERERKRKKENNTVDWVNYFLEAAFKLVPYSNRNV